MRHRTSIAIVVGLIAVATGSGCSRPPAGDGSGSATSGGPATGTLRGHLYGVGGPAPGLHEAWAGTVTIKGSGRGRNRDIAVASDGAYSVMLAPGQYTVVGHSPHFGDGKMSCLASTDAQVNAGATSTLDVLCHMR